MSDSTPKLVFEFGEAASRSIPLATEGATVRIGRGETCEIRLSGHYGSVSRLHAVVRRTWAGVFVIDAGRGGVFVDGERVRSCRALNHGDRLSFLTPDGDEVITYREPGRLAEPDLALPAPPGQDRQGPDDIEAVDPAKSKEAAPPAPSDAFSGRGLTWLALALVGAAVVFLALGVAVTLNR